MPCATAAACGRSPSPKGDAQAAAIYAAAYGQDREFYSFHRSLQAYRESFANKEDVLVLDPTVRLRNPSLLAQGVEAPGLWCILRRPINCEQGHLLLD